jgi:predicted amidophosphoribosyltransferase
VNLWVIFLAAALLTALLWFHRWRRRIPPGHCRACRYNLAGISAPICPECGSATGDSK